MRSHLVAQLVPSERNGRRPRLSFIAVDSSSLAKKVLIWASEPKIQGHSALVGLFSVACPGMDYLDDR